MVIQASIPGGFADDIPAPTEGEDAEALRVSSPERSLLSAGSPGDAPTDSPETALYGLPVLQHRRESRRDHTVITSGTLQAVIAAAAVGS